MLLVKILCSFMSPQKSEDSSADWILILLTIVLGDNSFIDGYVT